MNRVSILATTTLVALDIVGYAAPSLDRLNDVDMESAPMTLQGGRIFQVICQGFVAHT